MSLINLIKENIFYVFRSFFIADMDVISVETKKILTNPKDKKLYLDTVRELKDQMEKGEKSAKKTITLSDNSEITLSI
ncbi:hypothetical protein CHU00_17605 [Sphingobacterium cellulitidis]|uniref:hypothetical protein n=1 Tax=Sphingobacterium cellulitidis TaxID=1768011 RepID=UPI000B93F1BB|nr:hypothetical protein [Sphingobacterium cellulitidis]OYD44325.1 hypothetical protein CHU00_17605 [Sphingobacterium cellulitidis]